MSSISAIREYHGTRSFGSRENLIAQTTKIEDIYKHMEGIYYAFQCSDCNPLSTDLNS